MLEYWTMGLRRFGVEPIEVLKLLLKNCTKIYEINEREKRLELAEIEKILKIYTFEKGNHTNLFCV
jgi:hypothetical protein